MIEVQPGLQIPEEEIRFTFSRSGGPGGQNVNKVNTRATLWFDVENSPSLSIDQKERIIRRLSTRISKEGVLRVVSQKYRSQFENREAAERQFAVLIRTALKEKATRRKTKSPRWAKKRRLEEKSRRSRLKASRSKRVSVED
jgi:ribosome-associated protein